MIRDDYFDMGAKSEGLEFELEQEENYECDLGIEQGLQCAEESELENYLHNYLKKYLKNDTKQNPMLDTKNDFFSECECDSGNECGCDQDYGKKHDCKHGHKAPDAKLLALLLDELPFWLRIMAEHAKFIRGGADPSEVEIIKTADSFAMAFDTLLGEAKLLKPDCTEDIQKLVNKIFPILHKFIKFKEEFFKALQECQALAILPAALIDHIRKEADFFDGILHFVEGFKLLDRETLGVPNGKTPAITVPIKAIPLLKGEELLSAIQLEILFWSERSLEHADVLALFTRPEDQARLRRQLKRFVPRFQNLFEQACRADLDPLKLLVIVKRARDLSFCWLDFLKDLLMALRDCSVPTGQMNIWPLVVDHMRRETIYFINALDYSQEALQDIKC